VKALGADTGIDFKNQRSEDETADTGLVLDLNGARTQERSWAAPKRSGGVIVSKPVQVALGGVLPLAKARPAHKPIRERRVRRKVALKVS